jgi:hypothetical protein
MSPATIIVVLLNNIIGDRIRKQKALKGEFGMEKVSLAESKREKQPVHAQIAPPKVDGYVEIMVRYVRYGNSNPEDQEENFERRD